MLPAPAAGHPYPAIAGYDVRRVTRHPTSRPRPVKSPIASGPALDRIGNNRDQVEGRTRRDSRCPRRRRCAIAYAVPQIVHERADDGSLRYRSSEALAPGPEPRPLLPRRRRAQAGRTVPGRARRRRLAHADLSGSTATASTHWRKACSSADFPAEQPIMILSGNSIDHALLTLGKATLPAFPWRRSRYLFLAEPGPRQAQAHYRIARARPRLRR